MTSTDEELLEIKIKIFKVLAEIDSLSAQINDLQNSKKLLIESLRGQCPHTEVFETYHKKELTIPVMCFPKRMCTCCQLIENSFHGYEKLRDSTVVKKINGEKWIQTKEF